MFAAAVFDMDGLLIDSERVIIQAYVAAAADCGVRVDAQSLLPVVGLSNDRARLALEAVFGGPERLQQIGRRARERMQVAGAPPVFDPKPGAFDVLRGLAMRGVACAVASSTRLAEVHRRLGAVGLAAHFAALAGGDEVERAKPDPAIYRLAAARLGVAPERCLAFEDSDHGAQAALAAGMQVVVVPDLRPPQPHTAGAALCVLESLSHADPYLDRWFPSGGAVG